MNLTAKMSSFSDKKVDFLQPETPAFRFDSVVDENIEKEQHMGQGIINIKDQYLNDSVSVGDSIVKVRR